MINSNITRLVILTFIIQLGFTFCKMEDSPTYEKFQIISEIRSNKNSPFYIDRKKYPKKREALPIGVFDSGTGGLTVLNAIFEMDRFNNATHEVDKDGIPDFSNERFIYLADEANMPYGKYNAEGKDDFLRELIIKDVRFLLDENYYLSPKDSNSETGKEPVKAIVIACNTATVYGLETVKEAIKYWGLDVPVFGIVDAGSKNALDLLNPDDVENGIIGVLATEGTCASNGYPTAILKNAELKFPGSYIQIVQQPGIGLAGAIDGDLNYIDPSAISVRSKDDYKGPLLNDPLFPIEKMLLEAYNFDEGIGLLVETDYDGTLVNMQLNSISNYIKYAVTHLVVNAVKENPGKVLNSIIMGCTHYPYVVEEIRNHVQFLKNLNIEYSKAISENLAFIDPAESLAAELYSNLTENKLWGNNSYSESEFYISVPNPLLESNQIEKNWEFPYTYKYGRKINSSNQYVKIVPFSDEWIDSSIKERIEEDIPKTFNVIYNN